MGAQVKPWCRGGFIGATMGGMQRPGKCPACGKRVMPRRDGITRAHYWGTAAQRRKEELAREAPSRCPECLRLYGHDKFCSRGGEWTDEEGVR